MQKLFIYLLFLTVPLLVQASEDYDTICVRQLFNHQIINFSPKKFSREIHKYGDTVVLGNGRIWLRKVTFPKSKHQQRASIKLRLRSNGDPWDKSGSCFIIPATTDISMLGIAQGTQHYPKVDPLYYESFQGFVATDNFHPPVELLRFMTPFGVGAFTPQDSITKERVTPCYIDGFAPYVEWEMDVTDRLSLLLDSVYIGVTIDTWTETGYCIDLSLAIEENKHKVRASHRKHIRSLVNTYPYLGQKLCDLFNRQSLIVPFTLSRTAKNAHLFFITTGHGGHSGGDEFTPCEHILSIDYKEIKRFTPWRTDCASFRRFNPSSGVWLKHRSVTYINEKGEHTTKDIEEPIASSDLSRSNWCPGSDIPPEKFSLGTLTAGSHFLTISIPTAQASKDNLLNHWIVSAWLTWEE